MYTEDDKKNNKKIATKTNSSNENNNFYTPFMNSEKINKNKPVKKDNKKKKKIEVAKNDDYSDFYTSFLESEKEKKENEKDSDNTKENVDLKNQESYEELFNDKDDYKKKKNKMIYLAIGIIFAVLLLIIIISKSINNNPDIVLANKKLDINIGGNSKIEYKIVNTKENIQPTYTSTNKDIVYVDENGIVTGISNGEADIIVSYTINGQTKEKKCRIKVSNEGNIDKNIYLDVNIENAREDEWVNHDVAISVNGRSIYGISSLEYAINCDNDCTYQSIQDNKIYITNNGINQIKILARDKNNQQTDRIVNIKIDKEPPIITFNEKTNITSSKSVNVCATCKDDLSGCKEEKVCINYTVSKSNETISVEDNTGNQTTSPVYNVIINKSSGNSKSTNTNITCSLSVSKDGTVTANVSGNAKYYGFSSSYSGTNTKSTKINLNASKNGERRATTVYYYIKNSSGKKNSCSITVIKECSCTDKNSNSSNCPVTCTYRAG